MRIHTPDPVYTTSAQSRANFRLAFKIALGFVAACLFKQGIGEKDIEAVLLH